MLEFLVWRVRGGDTTLVAGFLREEDAHEYGAEYIEGDYTQYIVATPRDPAPKFPPYTGELTFHKSCDEAAQLPRVGDCAVTNEKAPLSERILKAALAAVMLLFVCGTAMAGQSSSPGGLLPGDDSPNLPECEAYGCFPGCPLPGRPCR